MADDIQAIVSGVSINHRNIVVNIPGTGYQVLDDYVIHTPVIANIQSKYDTRFDDKGYY